MAPIRRSIVVAFFFGAYLEQSFALEDADSIGVLQNKKQDGSTTTKNRNLRRGILGRHGSLGSNKFRSDILQLDKETRTEGQVSRVIVDCDVGEDSLACKSRILGSVSEDAMRIIHYMRVAHAYAVEVQTSHLDELDDAQEDPVREPMVIEDSIQIHHGRDLQTGGRQYVPYGIDLIKARDAWSQFGVKGENVRVCGKSIYVVVILL
jgi:hypothetical protein